MTSRKPEKNKCHHAFARADYILACVKTIESYYLNHTMKASTSSRLFTGIVSSLTFASFLACAQNSVQPPSNAPAQARPGGFGGFGFGNNPATELDHSNMMAQLGIKEIRRGKDGNNTNSPNYANYDESKANPFPNLPDPLVLKNGEKVTTPEMWWNQRRPEIVEDFDREVYGRVPANVPKVTWAVTSTTRETNGTVPIITKQLEGTVDNSSYPEISVKIEATLTTPADATGPVPVIIQFGGGFGGAGFGGRGRGGFGGTNGFGRFGRGGTNGFGTNGFARGGFGGFGGTNGGTNGFRRGGFGGGGFGGFGGGPSWQSQLLAKGWGYAVLNTGSIQADNGAGLREGIIGLCNKGQYRKPDDWGVLRAWGWGASRLLDYFETDPAVDAKQVGLEGHSRWGKATIVAMAYDQRFAIAYVSSSGEGGAKLSRRNWGEIVENVAGSGEYHWMAGNFIKYAGPLNWGDLPVDAHELIAMCAPRPVFISGGATQGDGWVDAKGMFMAAAAASPVYELLGKRGLGTTEFPPMQTPLIDGDLAFRQHNQGHTDVPNWPTFIQFASRYLKAPASAPAASNQ